MWTYNYNELYHHGVKGMKWGVRRERRKLIEDASKVTAKADPGTTRMVSGKYVSKRGGRAYVASHIVDEYGKVKLSYIRGAQGDHYIAAGKDYVDKHIDLKRYFKNTKNINIEYDVYS